LTANDYKQLGVGVVGLSADIGWAVRAHLPALRATDGFELRGLAASSPESAARAAEAHDVRLAYSSVADLAADPEIDLVVVSVRVPHHRELVLPALEAGKMVLCEWPLATSLAEAEELAAVAAERGVRTAVGLQATSLPAVRYLRDLIAEGYVGEVLSTTLVGSAGGWGATLPARSAYLADRRNGATMLTIPFGHTLAALTFCLGGFASLTATTATRRPTVHTIETGEPVRQTAEDQVAVSGVLDSGAVATMHYRGGSSAGTNLLWEINGTEGDIVVAGDSGHLQFGKFLLRGTRKSGEPVAPLQVPERYFTVARHDEVWSGVAHAYAQLRADVEEGLSTVPSFADGVEHHRLLERITRAAQTGTRE
jgi:predicted dehydrogenase